MRNNLFIGLALTVCIGLSGCGSNIYENNATSETITTKTSTSENIPTKDYSNESAYSVPQVYQGYVCTDDCSGHEAGHQWAESNSISDESECEGNSESFNEGCHSYLEENGPVGNSNEDENSDDSSSGDE